MFISIIQGVLFSLLVAVDPAQIDERELNRVLNRDVVCFETFGCFTIDCLPFTTGTDIPPKLFRDRTGDLAFVNSGKARFLTPEVFASGCCNFDGVEIEKRGFFFIIVPLGLLAILETAGVEHALGKPEICSPLRVGGIGVLVLDNFPAVVSKFIEVSMLVVCGGIREFTLGRSGVAIVAVSIGATFLMGIIALSGPLDAIIEVFAE